MFELTHTAAFSSRKTTQNHFGQQALAVLKAALADPSFCTIHLAAALRLPERTVYRHFRALTGTTPAACLRALRLERARHLLATRQVASLAEVAAAVGFDDPAYFARVFYQHYGHRATDHLR